MTGGDYERELCRWFRAGGWHAHRAGSSGGGTAADLPDLSVGQAGHAFAIEAKTTSAPYIYVDADEVEALRRYATAFGMVPLIAARYKGVRRWDLHTPVAMDRTDSGSYRASEDDETRCVAFVTEDDCPDPEWLVDAVGTATEAAGLE